MMGMMEQASSFAGDIDQVILIIAVLAGFWFILAELVLFYFCFKFRRRDGQPAQYISGEEKHQKRWIKIPHDLILVCDIVILIFAIRVWYNIKQDLPPADETIGVIGHQWAWRFVHPGLDKQLGTEDDIETVDELHVKVDTTYHFKLESADVLHSFSIPVFRLKQDAVPGRVVTGWFRPTKTGEFDFQCAEMCGIGHGIMAARVVIETPEQHDQWLRTKAG